MVKINLLPPELLVERERKRRQSKLIMIGASVGIVILCVFVYLLSATLHMRSEVAELQKQRALVESRIESYAPYAAIQADVIAKAALLKTAMGKPPEWSVMLASIVEHIPENIWLTDMTVNYPPPGDTEQKGQVTMRGATFDHPSTALWLSNIKEIPGVDNVRCVFSTEESQMGQELINFEIKATLLPGSEYEPLEGGSGI